MKSIYEAAVAYGREHQGTINIEDFEVGANYVLDVIADVVNQPMNDYLVLEELKKVILQLKK